MKLFEIAAQFRELELLADQDDIPEEALRDTLEGLTGDFEVKVSNIAKFVLGLQAEAEAIEEAAKAMQLRSDRIAKRADSIKAYILFQMQSVNFKRIDTTEIRIRRQANPVSVQITDERDVPAEFWRQPPPPPKVIDKKALKTALESGAQIHGIYLEAGEHVRISI
jgi:hypothetical protein